MGAIRQVEKCDSNIGVPVLNYYSMGKSENIKRIAAQFF